MTDTTPTEAPAAVNEDATEGPSEAVTDKALLGLVAWAEAQQAQVDANEQAEAALNAAIEHAEALTKRLDGLVAEKERLAKESGLSTKDLERWTRRLALADTAVERAIEKVESLIAA